MEPMELALKNYRDLSPIDYLQGTHDAKVHDVAFDGATLVIVSESWVSMNPLDPTPGQAFRPIFSRYRATFHGVGSFLLEALEQAPESRIATIADFMTGIVSDFKIALPNITIATEDHEIRFSCRSFDVERFAPTE